MTYLLGAKSLANLAGVDPALVAVAKLAITLTGQDFGFTTPQVRTVAQEEVLIAQGASHCLHSHHIPGPEGDGPIGRGGACDAVPWTGSAFVWEWPRIFVIARAFKGAAARLNTGITWGGVWDKLMSQYDDPAAEESAYVGRRQAGGYPRVFVDGPHFELGRN